MNKTDYSALADQYAEHRQVQPHVLARLVSVLTPRARVLEVGCGTGNYVAAIAERVGCECFAIDPSPEMLEKLLARECGVRAEQASAEQLNFPDGSFDMVYSVDVIHHVADRSRAFREAFRVLRDGGALCTVTDSEWIIRNREPLARYFPETVGVELARYPTTRTLCSEISAAGFGCLKEEAAAHTYYLTDAAAYREKTYSSLLYLSNEAFQRGLAHLEADLESGPILCTSRYILLWGSKPARPGPGA